MSQFLVMLEKGRRIDRNTWSGVINEFTRTGKRRCAEVQFDNAIFLSAPVWTNRASCFENENYFVALAGYVTDCTGTDSFANKFNHCIENQCEFIAEDFKLHGHAIAQRYKGIFTICIYNKEDRSVFVINDAYGLYPLFVFEDVNTVILCTEYEPILKYGKFTPTIDKQSVYEYFNAGSVQMDRTFFKSISNLSAGSSLYVYKGTVFTTKCRSHKEFTIVDSTCDDYAEEFFELFRRSVQKRISIFQHCNPLISLSGGVDTRCILGQIPNSLRNGFTFTTMITPPLQPEEDTEFIIANKIAAQTGIRHQFAYFDYWNENFDFSFFNKLRADNAQYIFSGHYGSEIFKAEFFYLIPDRIKRDFEKVAGFSFYPEKKNGNVSWVHGFRKDKHQEILSEELLKGMVPIDDVISDAYKQTNAYNHELEYSIGLITRSFFTNFWMGTRGLNLCQPYLTSQKFCCPFLDQDLLDFILKTPYKYIGLGKNKMYNGFVELACKGLLDIPTNSNYANHEDAVLTYFAGKTKPFDSRNPKYGPAFQEYSMKHGECMDEVYSPSFIKSIQGAKDLNLPIVSRFIDFEAWRRYTGLITD
jgi:hypothetical protein